MEGPAGTDVRQDPEEGSSERTHEGRGSTDHGLWDPSESTDETPAEGGVFPPPQVGLQTTRFTTEAQGLSGHPEAPA